MSDPTGGAPGPRARLSVTLLDVGWGDSILIESVGNGGERHFALVDCNDHEKERSVLVFVKHFFDRASINFKTNRHNFEWVLLTHGHSDHARGLKRMLSTFGTRHFWYPKSVPTTTYGNLLSFANRSNRVQHHQSIDATKILDPAVNFGGTSLKVLWPDHDQVDASNENNNSVVLALTLGQVTFVLTGDTEAQNWTTIAARLPPTVQVFQVPHHGGRNGVFQPGADATPWLSQLPPATTLALSSHILPHGHPHPDVVQAITQAKLKAFRTDEHSHLTFTTDGAEINVQYSHV
jgi:competence protein ComEC